MKSMSLSTSYAADVLCRAYVPEALEGCANPILEDDMDPPFSNTSKLFKRHIGSMTRTMIGRLDCRLISMTLLTVADWNRAGRK